MVLSTLLFAVLHTNPLGFFKGGDAFIDNGVLLILQILNGAIFACLYVLSGNLVVPIVTHTLYGKQEKKYTRMIITLLSLFFSVMPIENQTKFILF